MDLASPLWSTTVPFDLVRLVERGAESDDLDRDLDDPCLDCDEILLPALAWCLVLLLDLVGVEETRLLAVVTEDLLVTLVDLSNLVVLL